MAVKNRLKEIRLREYMETSQEFSKRLGMPLSTYSNIERAKRQARLETALEIAAKLGKKVEEIWYLD